MADSLTDPRTCALPDSLPLVFYMDDLTAVLRRSRRRIERLNRAGRLPERLPIPGRPCWSREAVLAWLNGQPLKRR
jgi:hypothetical protein